VITGSVYRKRQHLVLHDSRDRNIPVAGYGHRRAIGRMNGETLDAIDHHRFDIGDMGYAERCQLLFGQMPHIECDDFLGGSGRGVRLVT
jgi:hypothetical protein